MYLNNKIIFIIIFVCGAIIAIIIEHFVNKYKP